MESIVVTLDGPDRENAMQLAMLLGKSVYAIVPELIRRELQHEASAQRVAGKMSAEQWQRIHGVSPGDDNRGIVRRYFDELQRSETGS